VLAGQAGGVVLLVAGERRRRRGLGGRQRVARLVGVGPSPRASPPGGRGGLGRGRGATLALRVLHGLPVQGRRAAKMNGRRKGLFTFSGYLPISEGEEELYGAKRGLGEKEKSGKSS